MRTIFTFSIVATILSAALVSGQIVIIEPGYQLNQLNIEKDYAKIFKYSNEGISLAFSGGGARGLAQIGVLEVLEENNIPIKFVAGTSMGSVIGGLYCSGYSPKELRQLVKEIDWNDLFSSTPLRSSLLVSAKGRPEKSLLKIGIENFRPVLPRGITSGQKLTLLLTRLCYRAGVKASLNFDLLNPPFRATATDLISGKLEIMSSGDLAEAMRASMSFPVGFTPVATNGHLYADGGLINPVPVDLCREIAGGPVVAINSTTPLLPATEITDAIDMANQTTTVMSLPFLEEQLSHADIIITPAIGNQKTFAFDNIDSLIEAGRQATIEMLPQIKKSLEEQLEPVGTEYRISKTRFVGLNNMPETFLTAGLSSTGTRTENSIRNDLNKILKTGYINSAYAELSPNSDGSYVLTYQLTDNPRIKGFSFSGFTIFSPQTILKYINSKIGETANFNTLFTDVQKIEDLYVESGYSLARVKFPQINKNSGVVSIVIDEGRIQRISVDGNERTQDWIILRDFHLETGDVFTSTKAQRSLDDLYATGLFETVKLAAEPCSVGVALIIKVEEKSFDYVRGGIRYDREYKTAGFVDLVSANILGTGNEAYLSGQFGERKNTYQVNMKADRIFKTYLTYEITLTHSIFKRNLYQDHERDGYLKEKGTGFKFEIGQQFPGFGKLSAALNFAHYNNYQPGESAKQDIRITSLSLRSLVDTYNSLPLPESGKYHYFELELANDVLGGEIVYSKFYTCIEAYYPLVEDFNFHPRFELGFFNRTPPYFKLFFLGGRNSFYGLYDHEQAGAKILGGSFELRKKITDYLYIAARYDSGKVWDKFESIRFDQLKHGLGGSLVAKTIIGPVGIAYGRTFDGLDAYYFFAGYDY